MRVWFVWREWRSVRRMLGGVETTYAKAEARYRTEAKKLREGSIRLMYGDCIRPARTYKKRGAV